MRTAHVLALLTAPALAASCGSGTDNHPGPGTGAGFRIAYTHTASADGVPKYEVLDFHLAWYVENADGSVRGPFSNGATGTVDLGQESRDRVNLTRRLHFFYSTYTHLPARAFSYYTGDMLADVGSLSLTLLHTAGVGEVRLSAPSGVGGLVQSDPYETRVPELPSSSVLGADGRASFLVNYRASSADEPRSYYDFNLDTTWAASLSQTFDVATMKRCSSRDWTATADLGSERPYVIAQRNGLLFYDVGRSDSGGTSGHFGLPDEFPAESWYLSSGDLQPNVVTRFDPVVTDPVLLKPFDRAIVEDSLAYDASQRTFAFSLRAVPGTTGTDPVDLGRLLLTGTGLEWEIYFPGSAIVNGTLRLPALPDLPSLPAFDYAQLELYRLDEGTTPDAVLWFALDEKGNQYPSYARIEAHRDL